MHPKIENQKMGNLMNFHCIDKRTKDKTGMM